MKTSRQILNKMVTANKGAISTRMLTFTLFAILAAILYISLKAFMFSAIIIAGVGAFSICDNRNWKIRQTKLSKKRGTLNIGDFSKEFNTREISPVAIRYVFERLTEMDITANVLSSDHLLQMYRIDGDELIDIIIDFADGFSINHRALDNCEKMKIETIADLVEFIDQIYKNHVKHSMT